MFEGKVAVVTGAGSGIGKAVALNLAEKGAKVVVVNRTESKGLETLQEIHSLGGEGIFVQADVAKEEDVITYINKTEEEYGKIDMLVNNAGVMFMNKRLHEVPADEFKQVYDVNVMGAFYGMKYAIASMLRNGIKGSIVNTSSQSGVRPIPSIGHYSSSKQALIALTKTTAGEYGADGIRINAICPGFTISGMTTSTEAKKQATEMQKKSFDAQLNRIPLQRPATTEEMARHIVYLLSDDASYVTGTTLVADGGASI